MASLKPSDIIRLRLALAGGLHLGLHVGLGLRLALDLGLLLQVALELGLHLGAGVLGDAGLFLAAVAVVARPIAESEMSVA